MQNLADPQPKNTEELYVGYWLQRHGLSDADKMEVEDACARLWDEGLIQEVDSDETTMWKLTEAGVEEVRRLMNVFNLAPTQSLRSA